MFIHNDYGNSSAFLIRSAFLPENKSLCNIFALMFSPAVWALLLDFLPPHDTACVEFVTTGKSHVVSHIFIQTYGANCHFVYFR